MSTANGGPPAGPTSGPPPPPNTTEHPYAPSPAAPISWRAVVAWTVCGALCTLSLLGMLSIGIFVAPFAIGLLILLVTRQVRHAAPGLLLGVALLLAWVGSVAQGNRYGAWCSGSATASVEGGPAAITETCTGGEGATWFWQVGIPMLAALAVAVAIALLWIASRRARRADAATLDDS